MRVNRLIATTLIAVCMIFSFTSVTAFAYYQDSEASITHSGNKVTFKGKTWTDAYRTLVSHIETQLYVYNYLTNTVFYDVYGTDSGKDQLILSRIGTLAKVWYCNSVHGVVKYVGDSTPYPTKDTVKWNNSSNSNANNAVLEEKVIAGHHAASDEILRCFGYTPEDYSFYWNEELDSILPEQFLQIHRQLGLKAGDMCPGYYLDEPSNTLIAVNKNQHGENQLFLFYKNPDGMFVLKR